MKLYLVTGVITMSEKKAKQKRQQLKNNIIYVNAIRKALKEIDVCVKNMNIDEKNVLKKKLKELDDCVKNMSIDEKIKSIMRHSFNVRDDGEIMTYEDWKKSPEDVEQVFGEMVASLKMSIIYDALYKV